MPEALLDCRYVADLGWFTTNRLRRLLRLILLVQICGFGFMVAGTHGAFAPQPIPPTTTDFASFYAAGRLADRGAVTDAYDPVAHRLVEFQVVAPGVEEKLFLYPPTFLLICGPFARMPYLTAFLLFEALTFALWLTLATRIAGGGAVATMALACIPSVWWALGWGQNSFLSASLMGAGTLFLRRRPWLAGAAFGALCFKPHFGILIPVALVAGRHWRAILGAALSASVLCGLTTACFGVASWQAFFTMALHARTAIESGIQLAGHVDAGGALRLLGAPASTSWLLQAAISTGTAVSVAWLWARSSGSENDSRQAEANAGLIAGTLAAMPFVLFYDLVMAGVAAAWLARAARRSAWHPIEPFLLVGAALADLLTYPSAALLHVALGTLVAPALLWLACRRSAMDVPG